MASQITDSIAQLMALNSVIVHRKSPAGLFSGNRYTVLKIDGSLLLEAEEKGRCFGKSERPFKIIMRDASSGREIIRLRRPTHYFSQGKMQVFVNGQLVCVVRKKSVCIGTLLYIHDARDRPVLRVRGPSSGENGSRLFQVQSLEKKQIGSIKKLYGGFLKEFCTYKKDFEVQFPLDLDVLYKTAVIGTAIYIDFLRYEYSYP